MTTTPTPVATFTNTETNMEAYVYASTDKPGTYNVTLRDLDSGEMVPSAICGFADVEEAKAKARKVAGLDVDPTAVVSVAV